MGMRKIIPPRNEDLLFEVLRILVFLQVVVAVVTAIEASLIGAFMGSPGPAVATAVAAALTAGLYMGLGRRSPRPRRWLIRFQVGWMAVATLDLLLAIFLAQRLLEPIPLLTRFVLPYAIFCILCKPTIQAEFWADPDPASLIQQARDVSEEAVHAIA